MIGTDLEVFLSLKGNPFPAIGIIGGTKSQPRPTIHGAIQEDNVMGEFNIPPANSADEFSNSIQNVLGDLLSVITNVNAGFGIMRLASAYFEPHLLKHPQAVTAGCNPDFNAYTKRRNKSPNIRKTNLRSCGGHIHLSWEGDLTEERRLQVIKSCDLFLGVPSVLMDLDTDRKQLYGKAGAYRVKPYGVEYRTLSNFWAFDDPLRRWVYQQALLAIEHKIEEKYEPLIQEAINDNNRALAYRLVKECGVPMP